VIDGAPRFLIVRLGSLGDVIHAIPAAAALRRRYPEGRIDWLVDPGYVPLLNLVSGLDARIPLDPRGPAPAMLSAIVQLRRVRYDATLDLQGLLKSAVLARAAGGRQTIGFTKAHLREPGARLFYSATVDPGDATHVVEKNLRLVAAIGVTDTRVMFPLEVPRTDTAAGAAGQFGRDGYVLLNPGAAWPNKRWPAPRFGELAAAIHERRGLRSLVIWGPGEQVIAEAVAAASRGAAIVAPPTSIEDLFAIAQGASLMVSGDTGPLHIGGSVGTPTVSLFGPTRWERNGPWSAADEAISRFDRCSCHYERRCRLGAPCIDDIGLDEVMAAVERRLDRA
jgi:lipopolysaccharide heptosyltransferase I